MPHTSTPISYLYTFVLQLPNGEVSSDQLRYLAEVLKPYGTDGCADITTRANLQVRAMLRVATKSTLQCMRPVLMYPPCRSCIYTNIPLKRVCLARRSMHAEYAWTCFSPYVCLQFHPPPAPEDPSLLVCPHHFTTLLTFTSLPFPPCSCAGSSWRMLTASLRASLRAT